jgi:hypothetical protein
MVEVDYRRLNRCPSQLCPSTRHPRFVFHFTPTDTILDKVTRGTQALASLH